MEYSVREAKAHFAHAANVAASGERVVITKHGVPFVEIVAFVAETIGVDWGRAAQVRAELGIVPATRDWLADFNGPALGRAVLGRDD